MTKNNITDNRITKSIAAQFMAASEGASAVQSVTSPSFGHFTSKASNSRVKESYRTADYHSYREHERFPISDRDLMKYGDDAYYKVGIVRNIIDLMSDFCIKGIKWEHSNRAVEAFMNSWFRDVNGFEVSERFISYLLRMGNNIIYPSYSSIKPELAREWKRTRGEEFQSVNYKAGKIPSNYNFINPLKVSLVTKDIGNLIGQRLFHVSLSTSISNIASNSRIGHNFESSMNQVISKMPKDLKKKLNQNKGLLIFNEDELYVNHYRKDDWTDWARPMISCIFPQLITLEKMHLADMSALDGAISNIRLWRLGYIDPSNINNSFIPTADMLGKVRDLIHNNVSGGVLDLIWGPELDFKESNTQVHNFLGPEKYIQVMLEIYDGLGIPPALSGGGGGGGGGFTNNFISMKVLIDRLNYLRVKLSKFWEKEAKKVQKAMGFSSPAKLSFDDAIMSDEAQHKKLLIELWDRDILDTESVREEFNVHDKIVRSRINKETTRRESLKDPQKASPYHNPMWSKTLYSDMIKEDRADDDLLPFEVDGIPQEPSSSVDPKKPTPKNDNGRPFGQKDSLKRKQKIVRPRTSAFVNIQNWARGAYNEVSEIVSPLYLKQKSKGSLRELTSEELNKLEDFKLTVLGNHVPFSDITEKSVADACYKLKSMSLAISVRDELLNEMQVKYKRSVNIEDKRIASCAAYSLINAE